jgi:hypothetical protein
MNDDSFPVGLSCFFFVCVFATSEKSRWAEGCLTDSQKLSYCNVIFQMEYVDFSNNKFDEINDCFSKVQHILSLFSTKNFYCCCSKRQLMHNLLLYNISWKNYQNKNKKNTDGIYELDQKSWKNHRSPKLTNQNKKIYKKKLCLVPQKWKGAKNSCRGYQTVFHRRPQILYSVSLKYLLP